MDQALVSVVITTYKRHFDDIMSSIRSVLGQNYGCIEVILVDDNGRGSEYQTEIENGLKSSEECRDVVYIPNDRNSGAQVSRNAGILKSRGEFVAFLDDDDIWLDDKIEKQMKVMDTTDAGLVFSKGWLVSVTGSSEDRKPYNMSSCFVEKLDFSDLSYGDYIGTTTQVLVRRSVFANVGLFDIDQPARQDYEMWIRISEKYTCIGVPEYLFLHYHHQGEQISKNPRKSNIGYKRIYRKYRKKSSATAKFHLCMLIAKGCFKSRDIFPGLGYLFLTAWYGVVAFVFDHAEAKKRMGIHKTRNQ